MSISENNKENTDELNHSFVSGNSSIKEGEFAYLLQHHLIKKPLLREKAMYRSEDDSSEDSSKVSINEET